MAYLMASAWLVPFEPASSAPLSVFTPLALTITAAPDPRVHCEATAALIAHSRLSDGCGWVGVPEAAGLLTRRNSKGLNPACMRHSALHSVRTRSRSDLQCQRKSGSGEIASQGYPQPWSP